MQGTAVLVATAPIGGTAGAGAFAGSQPASPAARRSSPRPAPPPCCIQAVFIVAPPSTAPPSGSETRPYPGQLALYGLGSCGGADPAATPRWAARRRQPQTPARPSSVSSSVVPLISAPARSGGGVKRKTRVWRPGRTGTARKIESARPIGTGWPSTVASQPGYQTSVSTAQPASRASTWATTRFGVYSTMAAVSPGLPASSVLGVGLWRARSAGSPARKIVCQPSTVPFNSLPTAVLSSGSIAASCTRKRRGSAWAFSATCTPFAPLATCVNLGSAMIVRESARVYLTLSRS